MAFTDPIHQIPHSLLQVDTPRGESVDLQVKKERDEGMYEGVLGHKGTAGKFIFSPDTGVDEYRQYKDPGQNTESASELQQ